MMKKRRDESLVKSSQTAVDVFLQQVAATPRSHASGKRGRLIFAMDATASREPTWDRACHLQSDMFLEAAALGGLSIQLCFYRGYKELQASRWLFTSDALLRHMQAVRCAAGLTQIERVLKHAIRETQRERIDALVFVGDCMEEDAEALCHQAGQLGLLGVPVFIFHEGLDPRAGRAFQAIARLSGGAYCRFDAGSAEQLRDLLRAVAIYASGGRHALEEFGGRAGGIALQLTDQLNTR